MTKTVAEQLRDIVDRLSRITEDADTEQYAAKAKLTRQGAANLAAVAQYLTSPPVSGSLVKHPRLPDTVVFVSKDPFYDSGKFINYFEKLMDTAQDQLGFQPFVEFNIASAEPFSKLPPLS